MKKEIKNKKRLEGVIISDKMVNTAVVLVNRFVKQLKYHKYMKISKKYKADNPGNVHKTGEKVIIEETSPISKDKHFKIVEVRS